MHTTEQRCALYIPNISVKPTSRTFSCAHERCMNEGFVLLSRACVGKIGSICARLQKDATTYFHTDHPEVDFEAKTLRLVELEQRLVRSDLSQQCKPHFRPERGREREREPCKLERSTRSHSASSVIVDAPRYSSGCPGSALHPPAAGIRPFPSSRLPVCSPRRPGGPESSSCTT